MTALETARTDLGIQTGTGSVVAFALVQLERPVGKATVLRGDTVHLIPLVGIVVQEFHVIFVFGLGGDGSSTAVDGLCVFNVPHDEKSVELEVGFGHWNLKH